MAGLVNSKRMFGAAPHAPVGYGKTPVRRGGITLDRLEHESPKQATAPVLAPAHACQTRSTGRSRVGRFHAEPTFRFAPQR